MRFINIINRTSAKQVVNKLSTPSGKVSLTAGINQIAPIALLPILTILYSADPIASFQIIFSIAIVTQTLFSLGIEYRIPSTANRDQYVRLLKRSIYSTSILTIVAITSIITIFDNRTFSK